MRTFIEKKLQTLLNHYLAMDPESTQRLKLLENKVVFIELKGIQINLQLVFVDSKIQLKFKDFYPANTTIRGTPLSLLHMTLTKQNRKKFFANDISIEGDLDLAQHVIDLFDQLEIDWEEHISRIVGDVPAYQLGRFARQTRKFTTRLHKTLMQNVNEYTHEEINLFPPREALEDFFNDVDALRMDTDRLEARIELLIKKFAAKKRG